MIKIKDQSCKIYCRGLHQLCYRRAARLTATETERVQPESENAPAHDALTRLLTRLEPDAESLWRESRSQIDFNGGILILDDSTLENRARTDASPEAAA